MNFSGLLSSLASTPASKGVSSNGLSFGLFSLLFNGFILSLILSPFPSSSGNKSLLDWSIEVEALLSFNLYLVSCKLLSDFNFFF